MAPQRRAQPKRNRKVSDRMALVDDEDRKQAQTVRRCFNHCVATIPLTKDALLSKLPTTMLTRLHC